MALTFDAALQIVTRFHEQIGELSATTPQLLPTAPKDAIHWADQLLGLAQILQATNDLLLRRCGLELEELSEWLAAHANQDLVAAADAWTDRAYLLFGDAVAAGLPAAELFCEVHRSNLTKVSRGDSAKGTKGAGYEPPRLRPILTRAQVAPEPSAKALAGS